ncbi:PHB depolymerase family esterase [Sphingomonas sp. BIUV-7]|uniref:PHB depolymerase family esterase n=1 Tax=Sphingomonas natans TaxID=3063330 RepID=A0ABT8YB88_9SPHN|nr:PHB depolymerase family esterase [Sphingomonas sp. BIUV-7]MDO6415601.1 PHB depolymerase family esterase [Sphingomonas sp. BIUV-7]
MSISMSPFAGLPGWPDIDDGRLRDLEDFGSNPGKLRARIFTPEGTGKRPLVVVLHGCTQTAAGYDTGAGWSVLAEEQGFLLLFPEQQRANNPNLCFNWFSATDIQRDQGEALSIRQMIATLVREQGADPDRIFITGLSAGGAMASVMLATYPEVFAGGAIVAGLPYGTAKGVPQAMDRMRGHGLPEPAQLDALVQGASAHRGPWPTISVWHGTNDMTVAAANADAVVAQWRAVHGVAEQPTAVDSIDGHRRELWRDGSQRVVIEAYRIAGMGHGTPLDTIGSQRCGKAGPFMLEAGISSTRHIAASWGLSDAKQPVEEPDAASPQADIPPAGRRPDKIRLPIPRIVRAERVYDAAPAEATGAKGVKEIIERALKAAGLMR